MPDGNQGITKKKLPELSPIEWIGAISAIITIIGFLGYSQFSTLLPRKSIQSEIIGQWQAADRAWHLIFEPGNKFAMSTIGPLSRGNYRLDQDGSLWIDLLDGGRWRAKVKMPARDQLDLIDPDGDTIPFQRTS